MASATKKYIVLPAEMDVEARTGLAAWARKVSSCTRPAAPAATRTARPPVRPATAVSKARSARPSPAQNTGTGLAVAACRATAERGGEPGPATQSVMRITSGWWRSATCTALAASSPARSPATRSDPSPATSPARY